MLFLGSYEKLKLIIKYFSLQEITLWSLSVIFYFILKTYNTKNIIPSTISVTTSFITVYLTFRKSSFYAIGYAANDIVLIILWILAEIENTIYISELFVM